MGRVEQALAHLDRVEGRAVGAGPAADPLPALGLDGGEALLGPRRQGGGLLEEAPVARHVGAVAHRRRPLLGHPLAALVGVDGLAPAEHGGTGELGLRHLVVDEAPLHAQQVAGVDAGPGEPPLVAAEDHVRARDVPHDGGAGPVPDVAADGEGLRRHDPPERAGRGHLVVVVQRVRVLHGLDPPADVGDRHGLFQLPPPTGWPTWRSTSEVSNSMCSLTWVIVPSCSVEMLTQASGCCSAPAGVGPAPPTNVPSDFRGRRRSTGRAAHRRDRRNSGTGRTAGQAEQRDRRDREWQATWLGTSTTRWS